jgi:DNA-binding NarL/FixJ family response regulator
LRELASGATNQEIADRLFIAENTVKYHVHSILAKLELADRRDAATYAREHGLIRQE